MALEPPAAVRWTLAYFRESSPASDIAICTGRSCSTVRATRPMAILRSSSPGASVAIAKKGINVEQGLACLLCGQSFVPIKALYGFLSSSLWMSGSRIESLPLACFCPECTARLTIEFMHKVPKR